MIVLTLAFLACTLADVSELVDQGYDYPQPAAPANAYIPPPPPAPKNTYIPPPPPPPPPAPRNTYIPPPPAPAKAYIPPPPAPKNTYIPPAPVETLPIEEIEEPAQDGYRYKTVRRRVVRLRN